MTITEGYKLKSKNIVYNINERILSSDQYSIFNDEDGNQIAVSMFRYYLDKKLFSSLGKIEITDIKNNKYFFKELHVDTKRKEMIGSDVSVVLDQKNFGLNHP